MVADVRTVCPLQELAQRTAAPFYIAAKPNPKSEFGLVADSSADIAVIFSGSNDDRFAKNMKDLFYGFAKSGKSFSGIQIIADDVTKTEELENCNFWRQTDPKIVPNFGKLF